MLSIFKSGPRNIRQRLLRDIILLIGIIITALLALGLYMGGKIRQQASAAIISDTSLIVKKKFYSFTEPVETYLSIGCQWGRNGLFTELDAPELRKIFIPMLTTHSYISAVTIADSSGSEFFLKRDGNEWFSRLTETKNGRRSTQVQQWRENGQVLENRQEKSDFDPRQRPWFLKAAARPGEICWTDPYHFFTAGRQGVTASVAWRGSNGKTLFVMAFDLLEDDLLAFLNRLEIADQGHIILLSRNGSIIAHNRSDRLKSIDESPPVVKAIELWQQGNKKDVHALEFFLDRKHWWAGFTPLKTDEPSAWIAVVIPENKIMGSVKKQWSRIAMTATFILAAGIFLALLLVRKYSYQLRDLPRQKIHDHDFENELFALIAAGESTSLEFKSSVRMNLNTGKSGKEIEIAWLKTVVAFMNSDGGILLIGVNDDGEIVGIDADGFASEDKCRLHCKNLINTHIGPEFSRFIHLKMRQVQGKTIVVIECERVRKPVFLTVGKNEDFYVRSGPSSLKLSMSQMAKYLDERR
ncbi:MAG: hypothetical protein DRH04_09480 [Deltaproteobacteria bacterium]|nr:MAG: hypothetical protein DRH04_09480 [Deltaproteobacteria bacterium]